MTFGAVFERFLQQAPIPVMFRALLERAFDPAELDRMFEREATHQYTRELLFSSLVDLLCAVVCGLKPSVRNAFLASQKELAATLTAVYEKLKGVEPQVCRGLVRETTQRLEGFVPLLEARLPEVVPGYRVKILDGNHLAGTQHRPKVTRTTRAAVLPGQTLVVLDPQTMLIIDVVPCEDAYTQERALIDQVLPGVAAGDLWIEDRNFCTTRWVFGVHRRGGSVLVRQHQSTLFWEEKTLWQEVGRVATGRVFEQTIGVRESNDAAAATLDLRRIRLALDQPTREGETEILLVTDVPAERASALVLTEAYRSRWRIENAFQTLTEALRCEINTLAYPKAALFGFCVAVVAYNVLSVIRAALRAEHGGAEVETKVSSYCLAQEVKATYEGMMIALPPEEWEIFQEMSDAEMAEFLREAASQARLSRYPRTQRGPKKPRPPRESGKINHHVATSRLLLKQKKQQT